MAWVKTFRITDQYGVPDKDIRIWLSGLEEEAVIDVTTEYIPSSREGVDPRLCVIATRLDDPLPASLTKAASLPAGNQTAKTGPF